MSDATSSSSPTVGSAPAEGWIAGRYRVLEKLGSGGMAVVLRAEDTVARREVALKQLQAGIPADKRATFDALFAREYHTLARLSHRRIVQVFDYGVADGRPYYTMELLDKQDLKELAPLPPVAACKLLRDVASSLALIHAHRLIHRDVSPRNVRLDADGCAKLIDFGALASFGIAPQVIGTPPCMAPEMLRHMPLDQRADLYALGAVAYYVLTGRHAYPARSLQQLKFVWRNVPPPPSSFNPEIPAVLDTLVMSLLSGDRDARPASAAVVIDQLTSIGGLEPEELEHAAESYLSSSRMVGREADVQWLRKELVQASLGKGRAILFEGPTGIGKSRLMHELCLEAQLQGAIVVKADAQSSTTPFGVATVLMESLLRDWPEFARRFAPQHVNLLAQLSPSLREQLPVAERIELSDDPGERRSRFHVALHESFMRAARDQVLFLAVDNLHAADDNSAAFLTGIAGGAPHQRVILVSTQRSGAAVTARGTIDALRKRSSCARLRNLPAAACVELVNSLFGDSANTGRLARLLHVHSAGNPQQCMDLVRWLVKRNIAKYVGGTWVLPLDITADALPSQAGDVLTERLANLSAAARAVAEALSVYLRPVELARALALAAAEGYTAQAAHAALDELLDEEVLSQEGATLRFNQDDVRDAVISGIGAERRRKLHALAAEQLLTTPGANILDRSDAAWHLLLAGDESGGAALLIATVKQHMRARLESQGYDHLVECLLAALAIYDKQGRGPHDMAEILFPLMSFGFLVDWRVVEAHGERAIEVGLDITGLALAQRLQPKLGAKAAIACGLSAAFARFVTQRSGEERFELPKVIEAFCAMVPPAIAAWTIRYDHEGASRLIELLKPLRLFGPRHVTTLMHDYGVAQLFMVQGRVIDARELLEKILPRFQDPKITRLVGDGHLRLLKGGVLFAIGILIGIECENRELEIAAELERLDVQLWAMGAAQVRALHHANRGEMEQVELELGRVELFAIRGGTTWQADLFWPFLLLQSYLETSDRVGARRCVEQLELRAREATSLKIYADLGRAAYLTLRGELQASIALFERNAAFLDAAVGVAWNVLRMWFADALIASGQHQRAKDLILDTLSRIGPDHRYIRREQVMTRRLIAHAEAGLGNHAEAIRIVDGLLTEHGALDQPLLVGLLHKTRAELALALRDRVAFELHAGEMARRFGTTNNPALLAQWERLMGSAAAAEPSWPRKVDASDAQSEIQMLSQLTLSHDRFESALRMILQRSRAKAAHLYWNVDGDLRLVASTGPTEPATELLTQLRRRLERAERERREREDDGRGEELTVMERCAQRMRGAPEPPRSRRAKQTRSSEPPPLQVLVGTPASTNSSEFSSTETLLASHEVIPLRARRDNAILGGVILDMPLVVGDALDLDFIEGVSAVLSEMSESDDSLTVLEP